jgi:hypothetical protein
MNPTPYYEYILVKIYKENDLNAIHIRDEEVRLSLQRTWS